MRRRITIEAPPSLYEKIEAIRRGFKQVNGIDISTKAAIDFLGKNIRLPKIPDLLKNEKHNKKSRPY